MLDSHQDVAFNEQRVTFRDDRGNDVVADYDLLVAADGANSTVRQHLAEFDVDFSLEIFSTDRCYMSFAMNLPEDASSDASVICGSNHALTLSPRRLPQTVQSRSIWWTDFFNATVQTE